MATGAPRHGLSTAWHADHIVELREVEHHSLCTKVDVYAHPITSGRLSPFKQSGLSH